MAAPPRSLGLLQVPSFTAARCQPVATDRPAASSVSLFSLLVSPEFWTAEVCFWQFHNFHMLLGSDLLIFSNKKYIAVSLHLWDVSRQVTPLNWLEAWLDNVMASVPELAICYHQNGVVQGYELLKNDDIYLFNGVSNDGTPAFHPQVVQQNGLAILRFLQNTCKQDPGAYWADYYAHPEHYRPVFHERIAPYVSAIVNCMYWERRFPRLLSTDQLQQLMKNGCPLVGISDITCGIGGSIEFVSKSTSIEDPFFRYDPSTNLYHDDMKGDGVICLAVDILPTEFSKEASQHFGDILSKFVGSLASSKGLLELPSHLRRACIADADRLTSLYEYIPRMRKTMIFCG